MTKITAFAGKKTEHILESIKRPTEDMPLRPPYEYFCEISVRRDFNNIYILSVPKHT